MVVHLFYYIGGLAGRPNVLVCAGGGGKTKKSRKKKGNGVVDDHWELTTVDIGVYKRTCKHCRDQSYVGKTKNATRLANHSMTCSQVRVSSTAWPMWLGWGA